MVLQLCSLISQFLLSLAVVTKLHWFLDISYILVLVNSSINFLCYAMQSSRFRSAFIKILRKKKKDCNNQTRFSHVVNNTDADFVTKFVEQEEQIQMNSISIKKA